MKKTIISALVSFVSLMSMGQTQVAEFNPGIVAEGVNYILPKTGVKAEVTAMKVTYTPGEFAKYADRYLHMSGVVQESTTNWTVLSLDVYQEGVPDTTKMFTVKLKDKTIAPMAQLSKSGLLLAINTNQEIPERTVNVPAATNHKLDSKKYLTEEILSAISLAKMAELTAQEILDIRESKNAIRRGQADNMPKDGASLKIVLDELDAQEEALTQLFAGYSDTTYMSKTFEYTPSADVEKDVMFRFSSRLGFCDADDLAGAPYYISVKDMHTVIIPDEKEAAKRKIVGLVYNMPSLARVTVSTMSSTLYSKELPFAQFGTMDVLAPALFNKGATTKLTLHPATGGILHLEQ